MDNNTFKAKAVEKSKAWLSYKKASSYDPVDDVGLDTDYFINKKPTNHHQRGNR